MAGSLVPNLNLNPVDLASKSAKVAIKHVAVIAAVGTTVNTAASVRRQDQSDFKLRIESQDAVSKGEMSVGQYMKTSSLANEPIQETQDFLDSQGLLEPTEILKDTCTVKGPLKIGLPFYMPAVADNDRKLMKTPNKRKGSSSDSSAPMNRRVKTRSQSQKEKTSNSPSEGSARLLEISPFDSKIIANTEDYYVCPKKESEVVVDIENFGMGLKIPYYSSGSEFASVSSITESSRKPKQGQECTEVFSVSRPNPVWLNSFLFSVGLGVMYVVFLPFAEKGTSDVREFLNSFGSKNLPDDSNTLVTPFMNNLDEKTLINTAEIISRHNKNELTFNQAKLLLNKSALFNAEEIDILLEKDQSTPL